MRAISQFTIFVLAAAAFAAGSVLLLGEDGAARRGPNDAPEKGGGPAVYAEMAALALRPADAELLMPVSGVRTRQVADTWGGPRSGGRRHSGQDIFARRGTPVYSATAGYVLKVGENELGGKVVFVLGAGGRRYYYAHLDAPAPGLKAGDAVSTATLLGYVGSTGNARGTPPHLHFGVYETGGAVDPRPLLRDRTTGKG